MAVPDSQSLLRSEVSVSSWPAIRRSRMVSPPKYVSHTFAIDGLKALYILQKLKIKGSTCFFMLQLFPLILCCSWQLCFYDLLLVCIWQVYSFIHIPCRLTRPLCKGGSTMRYIYTKTANPHATRLTCKKRK